jgi:hypothetical protein
MRDYTPPSLTIVGSVADLTRENDASLLPDAILGLPVLGSDGNGGGGVS